MGMDDEIKVAKAILRLLGKLTVPAQIRVLRWLNEALEERGDMETSP